MAEEIIDLKPDQKGKFSHPPTAAEEGDTGRRIKEAQERTPEGTWVDEAVARVADSWVARLTPLEQPNPPQLKERPTLETREDRLATIQTALDLARRTVNQAIESRTVHSIEGWWIYNMGAIIKANLTPEQILEDAEVLVFLRIFLERAHSKKWSPARELMKGDDLPAEGKRALQELEKNDPLFITVQQIEETWSTEEISSIDPLRTRITSERRVKESS